MANARDEILSKALVLPAPERAQLAEELLHSLKADAFDDDVREAWTREIEKRVDEIREGSVACSSWEDVEAELVAAEARHGA